jgi:hypothetical protein
MSGDDLICAPCAPIFHVHQICPLLTNSSLATCVRTARRPPEASDGVQDEEPAVGALRGGAARGALGVPRPRRLHERRRGDDDAGDADLLQAPGRGGAPGGPRRLHARQAGGGGGGHGAPGHDGRRDNGRHGAVSHAAQVRVRGRRRGLRRGGRGRGRHRCRRGVRGARQAARDGGAARLLPVSPVRARVIGHRRR